MGPKKAQINSDSGSPVKNRRSLPTRSTRPKAPLCDGSDEDNVIAEVTTTALERALRESIRTAKKEAGLKSDEDLPENIFEPGPSTRRSHKNPDSNPKKKRGRPKKEDESESSQSPPKQESPRGPRATSTRILYVGPLSDTEASNADTESDGSGIQVFGCRTKKQKKRRRKKADQLNEKSPRENSAIAGPSVLSPPRLLRSARENNHNSPPKISPIKPILTKRVSNESSSIPEVSPNFRAKKKIEANVKKRNINRSRAIREAGECSIQDGKKTLESKKKTRFSSVATEFIRDISSSEEEEHSRRQRPYDEAKGRNIARRKAETDYEKSDFDSDRRSLPNIRIASNPLTKRESTDGSDSSMPILSRISSPKSSEEEERSNSNETAIEVKSSVNKDVESPTKKDSKKLTQKKRKESRLSESPNLPIKRKKSAKEGLRKGSPRISKKQTPQNSSTSKRKEATSSEEDQPRARKDTSKMESSPSNKILMSLAFHNPGPQMKRSLGFFSPDKEINTRSRSMKNIERVRAENRRRDLAEAMSRPTPTKRLGRRRIRGKDSGSSSSSISPIPRKTRSKANENDSSFSSSKSEEESDLSEDIRVRRNPVDLQKDSEESSEEEEKLKKMFSRRKKFSPERREFSGSENEVEPNTKRRLFKDRLRSPTEERSELTGRGSRLDLSTPTNPRRRPQNEPLLSSSTDDDGLDNSLLKQAMNLVKEMYSSVFEKHEEELVPQRQFFRDYIKKLPKKTYLIPSGTIPRPLVFEKEPIEFCAEVMRVFLPNGERGQPIAIQYCDSSSAWPRMKYWTYIETNITAKDCTRLNHIPQIEEDHDSEVFLKDLKKAYPEGVFGLYKGWGKRISEWLLYQLLRTVIPRWKQTQNEMIYLWKAIYYLFPNKCSVQHLENMYSVLRHRFERSHPVKPRDRSKREGTTHSVKTMMCVKCLQYHCTLHGVFGDQYRMHRMPNEDLEITSSSSEDDPEFRARVLERYESWSSESGESEEYTEACGDKCYLLLPKDSDEDDLNEERKAKRKRKTAVIPKIEPLKKEYQNLFRKMVQTDRLTICQMAQMIGKMVKCVEETRQEKDEKKDEITKHTCQDLYYLSKQITHQDRENSPDDILVPKLTTKEVQNSFRHFTWNLGSGSVDNSARPRACSHKGHCGRRVKSCICAQNESLCTKFCSCGIDCRMRFPGCRCLPGQCRTKQCQCYFAKWECDPDTCKNCNCGPAITGKMELPPGVEPLPEKWVKRFALKNSLPGSPTKALPDDEFEELLENEAKNRNLDIHIEKCPNSRLQRGEFKKIKIGKSDIAGYGCFIQEKAEKGELVAEYTGEVITKWEAERRGRIYDEYRTSYIFSLNREQSIDATRMGNYMRFANHSETEANCYTQIIMVNGEHRIGIFAMRDLAATEEILFDYQYNKQWKSQYCPKEKHGFVGKRRRRFSVGREVPIDGEGEELKEEPLEESDGIEKDKTSEELETESDESEDESDEDEETEKEAEEDEEELRDNNQQEIESSDNEEDEDANLEDNGEVEEEEAVNESEKEDELNEKEEESYNCGNVERREVEVEDDDEEETEGEEEGDVNDEDEEDEDVEEEDEEESDISSDDFSTDDEIYTSDSLSLLGSDFEAFYALHYPPKQNVEPTAKTDTKTGTSSDSTANSASNSSFVSNSNSETEEKIKPESEESVLPADTGSCSNTSKSLPSDQPLSKNPEIPKVRSYSPISLSSSYPCSSISPVGSLPSEDPLSPEEEPNF